MRKGGSIMLINRRCTSCKETIRGDETTVCGTCGKEVHSHCQEFEQQYDCPICAEELEIGLVEL